MTTSLRQKTKTPFSHLSDFSSPSVPPPSLSLRPCVMKCLSSSTFSLYCVLVLTRPPHPCAPSPHASSSTSYPSYVPSSTTPLPQSTASSLILISLPTSQPPSSPFTTPAVPAYLMMSSPPPCFPCLPPSSVMSQSTSG